MDDIDPDERYDYWYDKQNDNTKTTFNWAEPPAGHDIAVLTPWPMPLTPRPDVPAKGAPPAALAQQRVIVQDDIEPDERYDYWYDKQNDNTKTTFNWSEPPSGHDMAILTPWPLPVTPRPKDEPAEGAPASLAQ